MKRKHGIGMSLIVTLAALIMIIIIGVLSLPSIIYMGLKHLRNKIKL
jgi:hypothetical protein